MAKGDLVSNNLMTLNDEQTRRIVSYCTQAHSLLISQLSLRASMEEVDRKYMREKNWTRDNLLARAANYRGDAHKIADVTMPIVMPQVMAAKAYLSEVFTTGVPVFGVSTTPGQIDAAMQLETIIEENSRTAAWIRQMQMFFGDGLKYNIHGLGCEWEQRTVWDVETNTSSKTGSRPKKVIWNGNVLRRMDMYNTFFDPRVHPSEIHEFGEFAGYIEMWSRMRLKKYIRNMQTTPNRETIKQAFNSSAPSGSFSGSAPFSYYTPLINPAPLMNNNSIGVSDWMAWAGGYNKNGDGNYNGMYEVQTMYCRIIPDEFKLQVPDRFSPQVWKFVIINGQIPLDFYPLTNAHDWLPIFFGQPNEDGLDFQTKSFAQDVGDMQDAASAMVSGYLATQRRRVSDRMIYNPMMVSKFDISSTDPAAKIPLRPAAYGKDPQDAVYHVPFDDGGTETLLNGAQMIAGYADKINGQNPATQGQFVKGNKTQSEYQDVMGNGNSRNVMMALSIEYQVFQPLKECIKLNILQFQQNATIYSAKLKTAVPIDMVALRNTAVQFEMADGLTPKDKEMNSDDWQTALQMAMQSPTLGQGMDISGMYVYMMKSKRVDLSPFLKSPAQMQYEQALAAWQQAAQMAAQAKQPFTQPQPQPSPQLQQEMAQKQQNGMTTAQQSQATVALQSTTGSQTSIAGPQPQAGQEPVSA